MGVDITTYLAYGVKLSKNEAKNIDVYRDYLPEVEGQPKRRFDIVNDDMMGRYVFAGEILQTLTKHDGTVFDPLDLDIDKAAIRAKVTQGFGIEIDEDRFGFFMFNNFS